MVVHTSGFERSDKIIRLKFFQYFLPSLLTVVATSLNEFMDSIVIAQTLGQDSMTMVNMACPIMFVFSMMCVLLGIGGSIVYASYKGRMENKNASTAFSFSVLCAVLISVVFLAVGLIFIKPITASLSNGLTVPAEFMDYVRILFISAPFIIPLQVFLMFLPAEGKPRIAMIINIIANVVNILFDIIFTTVGQMGVAGAALATLTGYITAILVLFVLFLCGKCPVPFGKIPPSSIYILKNILASGSASAIGQFGLFVKVLFSNHIAAKYAGNTGVAVFSACNQTVSIASIFLGGFLNAMVPILAVLHSQDDHHGMRLLMKNVMKMEVIVSFALFVLLEIFPVQTLYLYGITDTAGVKMGITALRIFSFMYLFRQTVMIFLYYSQAVGRKKYAVILGILEGFAGILLLSFLFTKLWGITGLWLSYPVCSALLLAGIFVTNKVIKKVSPVSLKGFFLIPTDNTEVCVLDYTLSTVSEEISAFIKELIRDLKSRGIQENRAYIIAVACEELCIYTGEQGKKQCKNIDIRIRFRDKKISVYFCSIGAPFSPMYSEIEKIGSNLYVLNKLSEKIEYDYILGMNQTHILIPCPEPEKSAAPVFCNS